MNFVTLKNVKKVSIEVHDKKKSSFTVSDVKKLAKEFKQQDISTQNKLTPANEQLVREMMDDLFYDWLQFGKIQYCEDLDAFRHTETKERLSHSQAEIILRGQYEKRV